MELRAKLEESHKVPATPKVPEPKAKKTLESVEARIDPELQTLKNQMQQLQQQMSVMKVEGSETPRRKTLQQQTVSSFERGRPSVSRDNFFCYRCGGDGHIASQCQESENPPEVIRKLLRSLKKAKEGKSEPSPQQTASRDAYCNKSNVRPSAQSNLPSGLLGPASTICIKINGHSCNALLDSGSQVTIIFDKWQKRYLPNVPIHPITGLSIWGLSSTSYPYQGYVVVDVEFPATLTGVSESISVLALICPEPKGPDHIPVIIGTNANLFHRLAALCKDADTADAQACSFRILPKSQPAKLSHSQEMDVEEPVGEVRWMGPGPLSVPARGERSAICKVECKKPLKRDIVMVETSPSVTLPAEVLIQPVVLPSSELNANSFDVLLRNETLREVTMLAGTVIAHVYPTDTVTMAQRPKLTSKRGISHESTPVSDDLEQSHAQEVGEAEKPSVEDEAGSSQLQPTPDPVDASESKGGEHPAEREVVEDEAPVEELNSGRPRRRIKPVKRFTYDEPGKPVDKPLTVLQKCMVVHISSQEADNNRCKTLWCHPMAQCFRCFLINPCPERRGLIYV
ncbi:hypothetical protein N1851_015815 [Merluccius polli]|uniref:CCHC-type domain-containing protein n=1 Tax=Merluccius polli TaxID=89951 RepID=A0AA47MRI9_MERPO|nr:hypothetical protein N1851_015815 [Merluccius polli]